MEAGTQTDLRGLAFLTYGQAASLLNVGNSAIERFVADGRLWGFSEGRKRRVAMKSIADFIRRGIPEPGQE